MHTIRSQSRTDQTRARGFTLMELMVTLVVFAVVAGAITLVLMNSAKSKERTERLLQAEQGARAAMDLMARDLRSAGYGADNDYATPQPAIAYVDSMELIVSQNQAPYPDGAAGPGVPLAYNPAGSPKPYTLDGTAWQPPTRYRTGAELIRYTLDVNNDGVVNASDVSAPQGADAAATTNPNDFVLVREVYGDSTGNVATNNGGTQERVALVRKPGGTVPAMFTVYMRGSSAPWDWNNGAVPASQLQDIQRVEVRVTAAAANPDKNGQYAQTTLQSEVNSMRSVPDFGAATYVVSGYVYNDANMNGSKGSTEAGLGNAAVRLGSMLVYSSTATSNLGHFQFRAPAGTYTLTHTPPSGYGAFSTNSITVTITTAGATYSFGDTARSGGNVTATVYDDANQNGTQDAGESVLPGIRLTMDPGSPGANTAITNSSGQATLFTSTGGWALTCNKPDTLVATTPNPVSGSITNLGTATASFGLYHATTGTVTGKVYLDANRNATWDLTEAGIANVWVGVSKDAGVTVAGYALTNTSGDFTITVPINDPPHTEAYAVYCVPPAGYFPTSPQAIGDRWVRTTPPLTGNNFGMANYQVINLTASRVLSLKAADLIEADWNGNQTQNARADQDLILGSDAGGTDQVSVWFNQYPSSANNPLFTATPTSAPKSGYTRTALNSVMAMAIDTLDRTSPVARPDLVTGTKYTASGNFFVWFNQNSNNNEGYLPLAYSTNQNYKTADNGDVQAVVTLDCANGTSPDIVVGTKSSTANQGSIEVWQSSDAATPTFSRVETFNTLTFSGAIRTMGEVTGMALADFDNDGDRDLVVCTRTGDYTGQLAVFEYKTKTTGNRFIQRFSTSMNNDAFTSLAVLDANGDGRMDIVVGSQRSTTTGRMHQFNNLGSWSFTYIRVVDAPGVVMSLAATDLGGNASRSDVALGYRGNTADYTGGVRVYYMDTGLLPNLGVDPSNGSIINMVPALASANFNYGLNSTTPPSPYLNDLAVGVKITLTTGALVVFVR